MNNRAQVGIFLVIFGAVFFSMAVVLILTSHNASNSFVTYTNQHNDFLAQTSPSDAGFVREVVELETSVNGVRESLGLNVFQYTRTMEGDGRFGLIAFTPDRVEVGDEVSCTWVSYHRNVSNSSPLKGFELCHKVEDSE